MTSTTDAARDRFHRAWATEFHEPITDGTPLSEDFTGLRHHPKGPNTTAISCVGVILRLQRALEPYLDLPRVWWCRGVVGTTVGPGGTVPAVAGGGGASRGSSVRQRSEAGQVA